MTKFITCDKCKGQGVTGTINYFHLEDNQIITKRGFFCHTCGYQYFKIYTTKILNIETNIINEGEE